MDRSFEVSLVVFLWIAIVSAILDLKAIGEIRLLCIGATLLSTFVWLALFAAALTLELTCASTARTASSMPPPPSELIDNVLLTNVIPSEDDKCLICHDDIVHCVAIKACGHKFCDLCIRQYLTKWSYCPRDLKPLFDKPAMDGGRNGVMVDVHWPREIVWAVLTALSLLGASAEELHDESLGRTIVAVTLTACGKICTAAELLLVVFTIAKAVRPSLVQLESPQLQSTLCSIALGLSMVIGLLGQTSALWYLRLMALVCFRMPRLIGFVIIWECGLVRSVDDKAD